MITSAQLLALLRQRSTSGVFLSVLDGQWIVEVTDFYARETLLNQDELLTLIGTATQPNSQESIRFMGTFKAVDIKLVEHPVIRPPE